MPAERVVMTGLGIVSPLGSSKELFWEGLLQGRSGFSKVRAFDTSDLPVHVGAEVSDYEAESFFRRLSYKRLGRASQMAVGAARMALEDAGLGSGDLPSRVGVSMGTTSGEPGLVEKFNDHRERENLDALETPDFLGYPCHVIASNLASELGTSGPTLTIPTACAAGNYAIGHAFDLLRQGRVEMMLAGGSDSFSRITYRGFARLGAIAPEICQPFDRGRQGMIPGEGAAVIVLERLASAQERGAHIYAEVLGYGISCDSYHMTAGHPEGDGAVRAMKAALAESKVDPREVEYISAHGTGTPTNDRVESMAVQTLFGERFQEVPISSIKSMIGHTMGAASALEAAACALALETGWVPPTANFEEEDPECPLDCIPNTARELQPRIALNNAYAFGGNNASLCLARFEE